MAKAAFRSSWSRLDGVIRHAVQVVLDRYLRARCARIARAERS
jgi:hypothetical protein